MFKPLKEIKPFSNKRNKIRRISPDLEYKARQNNLTEKELAFLEGLLNSQKRFPQLTKKQWEAFLIVCYKEHKENTNG